RIYAALANGGVLDGVQIISPRGVERMIEVRSDRPDRALGPRRWATGIALNTGLYGPNADTFGHSGWGGSFGCADRESGIAIGYVMNRMAGSLNDDPRARRLAEAVFNAVGSAKS
ncbi:MAG TPA: serine hydrolase, partial [Terricaulis sp.]|nr:serine hydrolase [Terricaulis sp.]